MASKDVVPIVPGPLRGMLWPVGNLLEMSRLTSPAAGFGADKTSAQSHFSGKPVANTFVDHLGVQLSTLPKLLLAAYVWSSLSGGAAWREKAAALDRDWVLSIFARDMLLTWVIAGGWEFLLYSKYSPFSARLAGHKLNPSPPRPSPLRWPFQDAHAHDAFWSTVSTLIWSAMEVGTAHFWATGRVAVPAEGAAPGDGWVPDVGAFLYTWVHSLHHKSKNPTCWSGVSMHPLESSTYYTAMWIPIVVAAALGLPGVHPIVMMYTKMDLHFAALIGHDGIGYPGAASQAHWLHHNNMDVRFFEGGGARARASRGQTARYRFSYSLTPLFRPTVQLRGKLRSL